MLYFYFNLSICVYLYMSVCLWTNFLQNKCTDRFGRNFPYRNGPNTIEIGDLWSKVKATVMQYLFFLHNFLLTSLLWISALLHPIKIKFDMSLIYALGRFVYAFHQNRMCDDVIVASFSFPSNNCQYINSIELTNIIQYTNINQNEIHLMIKVKKMNKWSYL